MCLLSSLLLLNTYELSEYVDGSEHSNLMAWRRALHVGAAVTPPAPQTRTLRNQPAFRARICVFLCESNRLGAGFSKFERE